MEDRQGHHIVLVEHVAALVEVFVGGAFRTSESVPPLLLFGVQLRPRVGNHSLVVIFETDTHCIDFGIEVRAQLTFQPGEAALTVQGVLVGSTRLALWLPLDIANDLETQLLRF